MQNPLAQKFISALEELERTRDVAPIIELFDEGCILSRISQDRIYRGKHGARQFWTHYLHAFDRVRTEFTNVLEGDRQVALEWKASARLPNGKNIVYEGISVLRIERDRILAFRTYYDASVLLGATARPSTWARL